MWVVVGEEKWDKATWERYHQMEIDDGEAERFGWVYEETYEKYCEEFDKAKAGLFESVEGVARIRKKLFTTPYGDGWEELCDEYSDYHKDVYGFRPKDIGDIMKQSGITREMRDEHFKKKYGKFYTR